MAKPTKKQIEAMRKLGMTEDEIKQVLADDKRIDKGEKLFELTAEQTKEIGEAFDDYSKKTVKKGEVRLTKDEYTRYHYWTKIFEQK